MLEIVECRARGGNKGLKSDENSRGSKPTAVSNPSLSAIFKRALPHCGFDGDIGIVVVVGYGFVGDLTVGYVYAEF